MKNIDLLRQIPLFRNLDDTDLNKLATIATEETFSPGCQIFTEGSIGDSLFIIKYGTIRVFRQGERENEEVTYMSSGQHFGEMALIDDEPRSATVEAVEHTETICITREALENLVSQDNKLGFGLYKRFAKHLCLRLQETTSELCLMRERAKRNYS